MSAVGTRKFILPVITAAVLVVVGSNVTAVTLPGGKQSGSSLFANLPLSFEANQGQVQSDIKFLSRGQLCNLIIEPTSATLSLYDVDHSVASNERSGVSSVQTRNLLVRFVGANMDAEVVGDSPLKGTANYLIGNEPAGWRRSIPMFGQVVVRKLYAGVDLVYYGNQNRLEFDFNVAAGADALSIVMQFDGADMVRIAEEGDLVIRLGNREIRQQKPFAYQMAGSERRQVPCEYSMNSGGKTVHFRIGEYDKKLALIIDPILSYSSYFGGTGTDNAWDVAIDASGAVYIAGDTLTAQLPTTPASFQTNFGGSTTFSGDAFVAKLDGTLTNLVYLTYLGGMTGDAAQALAVDGAGNVYLTGYTDSTNFPTANTTFTNINGNPHPELDLHYLDAFVTKLNASGSSLDYSLYLGGSRAEQCYGISVDSAGQAYVVGGTTSSNLFRLNAAQTNYGGGEDAFIAKLNAAGQVLYCTYFGGTNQDRGINIMGDAAGFATIVGFTRSVNFPVTNAIQSNLNQSSNLTTARDAFVARFTPDGVPVYSTFWGGIADDQGSGLALDAMANAVVTGWTSSTNFFVTSNSLPTAVISNRTSREFFVSSLDLSGAPLYSLIFGGTASDESRDVAVDLDGNIIVVGNTSSTNLPTTNTVGFLTTTNAGSNDVFVVQFSPGGDSLLYSVYLGGRRDDTGYGVAVDPSGNAYVVGRTASTNFPTTNSPGVAPFTRSQGSFDAFLAKVSIPPVLALTMGGDELEVSWPAFNPEYVLESSVANGGSNAWQVVEQPSSLDGGKHRVSVGVTNETRSFRLRKP
jgi:hypothetical protein